jgi:methylmalonyl-CoA mutase cobalamin-binding subunit
MRRWVDAGAIATSKTVGGHRRIPVAEAVRFVRERALPILDPAAMGLGGHLEPHASPELAEQRLYEALASGDRAGAHAIAMSLFAAGWSVSHLFDGPFRSAMHRVGELWHGGPRGILVEHRATQICAELIDELRRAVRTPAADAPLALGGAPENDPYSIPSAMAALVLADAGLRDINYGPNTPCDLLGDAAVDTGAKVVWLSLSVNLPKEQLRQQLTRLARRLGEIDCTLILGGRHADDISMNAFPHVLLVESMGELAAFVRGLVRR